MDENFAIKSDIGVVSTTQSAQAANRLPLNVSGQSKHPVTIRCDTLEGFKHIHLGIVLIVKDLGVECLIGEPGKQFNNIICLPLKKIIIIAGYLLS